MLSGMDDSDLPCAPCGTRKQLGVRAHAVRLEQGAIDVAQAVAQGDQPVSVHARRQITNARDAHAWF
jgi:hypothetical protein